MYCCLAVGTNKERGGKKRVELQQILISSQTLTWASNQEVYGAQGTSSVSSPVIKSSQNDFRSIWINHSTRWANSPLSHRAFSRKRVVRIWGLQVLCTTFRDSLFSGTSLHSEVQELEQLLISRLLASTNVQRNGGSKNTKHFRCS